MTYPDPELLAELDAMARQDASLKRLHVYSFRGGGQEPLDTLTYSQKTLFWERKLPRHGGILTSQTAIGDGEIREFLRLFLGGEVWNAKKAGLPSMPLDSTLVALDVTIQGLGEAGVAGNANDLRHSAPRFWEVLDLFHHLVDPPPTTPPTPLDL